MSSIKPTRWAILDCNSFYCSCERLFRPHLIGRPVAVLSNNDGCMISVSKEAKALGLKLGAPVFEVRDLIRRHRVQIFSSNYQLYGDLSRRVMRILDELNPEVIQYSIDEAFINFSHVPVGEEEAWAQELSKKVFRDTGIPVSIGVSTTKTLAKVANRRGKKLGLKSFCLLEPLQVQKVLEETEVGDVWGIGAGSKAKLNLYGIKSAWDFREFQNTPLIRSLLTVTGERLRDELRGIPCVELAEMSEKKMIASTRSFGKRVYECRELEEAISTYVGFACEKLRAQGSVARGLSVMLRTNPFDHVNTYYRSDAQTSLPIYTNDTGLFTKAALTLVRDLFQKGLAYKKAGVFIYDITPNIGRQQDLFQQEEEKAPLMEAMDGINKRWGRGTIRMASCGTGQDWRMLSEQKSNKTQLNWNDLVEVRRESKNYRLFTKPPHRNTQP
ncbi:MAG: Y-family DNA polymerase [Bacteriovoracaceae bacterium]|nr:Y-family DNA polymerase [Bacteriovoracaceae bacterium]